MRKKNNKIFMAIKLKDAFLDVANLGKKIPKNFNTEEVDYIVQVSEKQYKKYANIIFKYLVMLGEIETLIQKEVTYDC